MNPTAQLSPSAAAKGRASRTLKKAAAARANGKLGGRPRKACPSAAALFKRAQRAAK